MTAEVEKPRSGEWDKASTDLRHNDSAFAAGAAHHEVRLVRKVRAEAGINRASGCRVDFEIIQHRKGRIGVACRHDTAILTVAGLHLGCLPALRLIRLPVERSEEHTSELQSH